MKLELKHLAPYVPYMLDVMTINNRRMILMSASLIGYYDDKQVTCEDNKGTERHTLTGVKPILRPLSDLTKQNKIDGKVFVPLEIIQLHNNVDIDSDGIVKDGKDHYGLHWLAYESKLFLFKWHFDVFGLIEKGLAIDINTLNKQL